MITLHVISHVERLPAPIAALITGILSRRRGPGQMPATVPVPAEVGDRDAPQRTVVAVPHEDRHRLLQRAPEAAESLCGRIVGAQADCDVPDCSESGSCAGTSRKNPSRKASAME